MACTAPQNVSVEVSTLAPGGSCSARSASSMAAVQEDTVTACTASTYVANSASKARHSVPVVSHPELRTSMAALRAAGAIQQSANGIVAVSARDGATVEFIIGPQSPLFPVRKLGGYPAY
jgi:hypothetical protein